MDRVVCIKDSTNAALHALALAALQDGTISASAAASRLGVSSTYLSKILQDMVAVGIVESVRGFGGGFLLARPAKEISCLDVVEALEGASFERYCLFESPVCTSRECMIHAFCSRIQDEMRKLLSSTSVADLAMSFLAGHDASKEI